MKRVSLALALFFGFAGHASTVHEVDPCEAYLRDFYGATYFEPTAYWRSRYLRNEPLRTRNDGLARARWIVAQHFDRGSALWLETLSQLHDWAASEEGALKTVLRAIELAHYTPQAASEARMLDSFLETDAKILQLGGSTGWLAGYLLRQHPNRKVHVVEPSTDALDLAQRRWRVLLPLTDLPTAQATLFRPEYEPPHTDFDAMVVSQTYFRMQKLTRAGFFRRAWDVLRDPRGPADRSAFLVLTEPVRGREKQVIRWATTAVETALRNGAPHTEFDAALFGMFYSGLISEALSGFGGEGPRFVTATEIIEQAQAAGFSLYSQHPASDGICDTFLFAKR